MRSCGSSLATSSSPGRTQMLRWMLRWKLRGLLWRKEWPSVSSTLVSLFVAVKQNSRGKTLWRNVSPERCLLRSSMRSCGSSLATSSSPGRTRMLRWKLRGLLWRKEWPSVSSTLVSLVVAVKQNSRGKTPWRNVSPERCLLRSSMRSCGSSLATFPRVLDGRGCCAGSFAVCFGGRSGLP